MPNCFSRSSTAASILRGDLDDGERARLLAIREQRPQPERDDKAMAG